MKFREARLGVLLTSIAIFIRGVYTLELSVVSELPSDEGSFQPSIHYVAYYSSVFSVDGGMAADTDVVEEYAPSDASTNVEDPSQYEEPKTSFMSSTQNEGPYCSMSYEKVAFLRPRPGVKPVVVEASIGNLSKFGFFGGDDSGAEALDKLIDENRKSGGVLLVDFYADWCKPCQTMKQNLNAIEDNYKDGKLVIHKVNVDEDQELASEYEVTALPTLIFFSRGEEVKRVRGLVDVGALIKMIDDLLDQIS